MSYQDQLGHIINKTVQNEGIIYYYELRNYFYWIKKTNYKDLIELKERKKRKKKEKKNNDNKDK